MLSPLGRDLLEQRWARGANLQRLCRPWRCVILGIAHIKTICTASRDRRGQSQVPIPECRSRRIATAASTETVLRRKDAGRRVMLERGDRGKCGRCVSHLHHRYRAPVAVLRRPHFSGRVAEAVQDGPRVERFAQLHYPLDGRVALTILAARRRLRGPVDGHGVNGLDHERFMEERTGVATARALSFVNLWPLSSCRRGRLDNQSPQPRHTRPSAPVTGDSHPSRRHATSPARVPTRGRRPHRPPDQARSIGPDRSLGTRRRGEAPATRRRHRRGRASGPPPRRSPDD